MSYLQKAKKFVTKYWEILVAAALVAVGFVLGTSGNREKVLKKDIEAQKKSAASIQKGTDEAIEKHARSQEENENEKAQREKDADEKKDDRKEELLKDSEKLDKVLKEKYGLKGD